MTFGKKLNWDLDTALKLRDEGKTCREIAEMMGLTREQVYDAFRNRDIKIVRDRRGFPASWDMEKAKALADEGKPIFEIAKILGVPQGRVRAGFKNRGWKAKRTRSGRHITWDVKKAEQLRDQGLRWIDIDRALDLAPGTVRHYFVRRGLHTPRRQPNMQWDIYRARRLRERGMGWREIGEIVGTDGNNIRRAFVRRGWLVESKPSKKADKVPKIGGRIRSLRGESLM